MQVKQRSAHIHRLIAIAMLWVFMLALTPWSSFHHHQEIKHNCENETVTTHKGHISTNTDHCLICSAHFEKNYVLTHNFFDIFQNSSAYINNQPVETALYTELISTSLRGPPLA